MAVEVLLLSNDLAFAKNLSGSSKLCVEQISVHPCTAVLRFRELVQKIKFDFLLIDESFHSPEIETLIRSDKLQSNTGTVAILISSTIENSKIREKLEAGYTDVILKPVDLSILLHKIDLYRPNTKTLKEDLLFRMDVDGEVGLMLSAKFIQASEFGAVLRSGQKLEKGEVVSIHPQMFSTDSEYEGETCLARVIACRPYEQSEKFDSQITFVAPGPRFMTAMRLWMRSQFIVSTHNKVRTK